MHFCAIPPLLFPCTSLLFHHKLDLWVDPCFCSLFCCFSTTIQDQDCSQQWQVSDTDDLGLIRNITAPDNGLHY
ncbi:hypothetical protein ASPVEDRAFT_481929 [Aspergillus versicolor CBS 583.65]|uniref:Uncharacterized protein n=1 Tax=Aspergillus versicolor CBS 583.65 TaxID=1036611 RepID=A0A1L9PBB8_ASPVE|nr:uncharacterized protein ASPVEDRAFT_481929 [Aspergillus versicolor CBS 583.65]OJI98754.1 hypothetical protein ASPVEDRAFT_481929 [Aspergillus versicolor CBS 583.65]